MTSTTQKRRFRGPPIGPLPNRDDIEKMANRQDVIDATNRRMADIPLDSDFESFEELKKRRDKMGIVRLKP